MDGAGKTSCSLWRLNGLPGSVSKTSLPLERFQALASPKRDCLIRFNLVLIRCLDVRKIESAIPKNHGHLAKEIPGASSFLHSLASFSTPWAIVTSSTAPLAHGWLNRFDLPSPEPGRLITAESVEVGKPDPTCYILGHDSIRSNDGVAELLVIEDSPAGIRAGKEANCKVLGLLTTHTYEQVAASGPDWIVKDLECVRVLRTYGQKVVVEIRDVVGACG